jgi:hypothetical protein
VKRATTSGKHLRDAVGGKSAGVCHLVPPTEQHLNNPLTKEKEKKTFLLLLLLIRLDATTFWRPMVFNTRRRPELGRFPNIYDIHLGCDGCGCMFLYDRATKTKREET